MFDKMLKTLGDYLMQSFWQKISNEKSLTKLTFDIAALSLYVSKNLWKEDSSLTFPNSNS